MTGNSKQIKKLKYEQEKKKRKIKDYKKKMKRNIFLLAFALTAYTFICLDDAYKTFGSVTNFLMATVLMFLICIAIHFLVIKHLIGKREKEIKSIRSKLYRLMKLDNE